MEIAVLAIIALACAFHRFFAVPIDRETRQAERDRQASFDALPKYEQDRILADRIIQYNRTGK